VTVKKPTQVNKFLQAPPLVKRYDFVKEYGNLIDETLLRLEKANGGLKVARSISPTVNKKWSRQRRLNE